MLDDVDIDGRVEFSERVAHKDSLPGDVARQLAQDEVEIAGPMLQHSPVLTDEDFVAFSQTLSPKHLESIAQRETLSGAVTDALIENGTRAVWHKVTQNQGAEITPKGFDKLVSNASDDKILQVTLATRPDITEDAAKHLLPLLPPEGKARLAKLLKLDAPKAEALISSAQKQAVGSALAGRQTRVEAKLLVDEVKAGKITISAALMQLIDADRTSDVILLLASIVGLDEAIVSNAFYQMNEEPIAILCKSLDVNTEAFSKLMSMRCEKLKQPLSTAGRSIVRYKELDITSSQRAMRFVQMRNNVSKPE